MASTANELYSWIKRHKILSWAIGILLVLIILCVAFLGWVFSELLANPVCDGWKPGMTKEEKISLGLQYANSSRELAFELRNSPNEKSYLISAKQIPYKNISEILSKHPDCCCLVVQGFYDSNPEDADKASDNVQRDDEGTILLRYPGKYLGSDEKIQEATIFWHANLNYCKIRRF